MRAMLDACVLYPTVMREVLIGAADQGMYQPRWSARILEEWARAAARVAPASEPIARGEIALLRAAWPGCEAFVDQGRMARYWLPDKNDIHVLAAAAESSCDLIITMNAKDFPQRILAEEGLSRQDPDGFVVSLFHANPELMHAIAMRIHAKAEELSGQPWDIRKLYKKARMPRFGKAVSAYIDQL
ncbi:RSP_2648 family PIN domain-containing protein [Halocynthiibacter namhaensis]|uniref:RSP_2648 family PIN domain-containing protein n=1 Tax=Halocynthiibacter namhaensis TaxID=1290553 RepID=UPI0005792BDC|nr:PIN domain-containing protein [Halocynthiibacter namhaensis]